MLPTLPDLLLGGCTARSQLLRDAPREGAHDRLEWVERLGDFE